MSGLKTHTEQFRDHEIRFALLTPKITAALIWELTTRINLFEQFGGLLSYEFGNLLIDEMREWRASDNEGGSETPDSIGVLISPRVRDEFNTMRRSGCTLENAVDRFGIDIVSALIAEDVSKPAEPVCDMRQQRKADSVIHKRGDQ